MGSDRLNSESANQTGAASQAAPQPRVCYVEPAPAIDVMFEQLEYLFAHKKHACRSGCADCIRLRAVEGWLLQPFRASDLRQSSTWSAASPMRRVSAPNIPDNGSRPRPTSRRLPVSPVLPLL